MVWNSKVIWSEGMFLQPQHLQQHDRHLQTHLEARTASLRPYSWGFTSLELDDELLKLGKIALRSAVGVLPDGTPFSLPGDDDLPEPLDVPEGSGNLLVVLALPVRREYAAESGGTGRGDELTRYRTTESEVPDSNDLGAGKALMQLGKLRLRLALEQDVANAYVTLGIVRVAERLADSRVVLEDDYCPPCLDFKVGGCLKRFSAELHGLLQQRGEALAARLGQEATGTAEIADFLLLQMVNRAQPLVAHLDSIAGCHPEDLFRVTVQMAGELSTFSLRERRTPVFPVYRHDRLRETFKPVINALRAALSRVADPGVVSIPLEERKYGLRVAQVADKSLFTHATFVLAVRAQVSAEVMLAGFAAQVKVGAMEKIRDLVNLQLPGIRLRALPVAPRQLPFHAGFTYFELDDSHEGWQALQTSAGMALHVAGDFPGLTMECWAIRR
ncbi:type VI secretion system baseplate subunit TssK [Paraburkholderia sp. RL18-103-BIB-C]|jgi:type VI secretion system protein ImpJ|uniref:type VI secretion system baseplate subunit TssK n=1 Tax=unclassified Paraburkholderia TaxID=2615204 RepID=UPI0038BA60DB